MKNKFFIFVIAIQVFSISNAFSNDGQQDKSSIESNPVALRLRGGRRVYGGFSGMGLAAITNVLYRVLVPKGGPLGNTRPGSVGVNMGTSAFAAYSAGKVFQGLHDTTKADEVESKARIQSNDALLPTAASPQ